MNLITIIGVFISVAVGIIGGVWVVLKSAQKDDVQASDSILSIAIVIVIIVALVMSALF